MVTDGRAGIDAALVQRLVATQFPQWGDLQVIPVEADGWDNRTYRLGAELSVRLPTAASYAPGVLKEHRWLPVLGPQLPLPVPEPVALGVPGEGYPHHWSVNRWLQGESAHPGLIEDSSRFAADLAGFLRRLRTLDTDGAPAAGAHSFFRGTHPAAYDEETRRCLARLEAVIPADRAVAVWDEALASTWQGPPVWFHGDVAAGNLLVRDGRLCGVIDFGTSGAGDPACDLVIAWTLLDEPARRVFRRETGLDEDTWARARGWALWKALLGISGDPASWEAGSPERHVVELVLGEHEAG
jgi:aminoglycoside phosphotransferase (APT) family kinase protein